MLLVRRSAPRGGFFSDSDRAAGVLLLIVIDMCFYADRAEPALIQALMMAGVATSSWAES